MDGTHIPVSPPPPQNERAAWRNRKRQTRPECPTLNDMEFTDLLCRWEGIRIVQRIQRYGLKVRDPEQYVFQKVDTYVFGDAGFANCDLVLTPYYIRVRYLHIT
jgi:hypothetical protein